MNVGTEPAETKKSTNKYKVGLFFAHQLLQFASGAPARHDAEASVTTRH